MGSAISDNQSNTDNRNEDDVGIITDQAIETIDLCEPATPGVQRQTTRRVDTYDDDEVIFINDSPTSSLPSLETNSENSPRHHRRRGRRRINTSPYQIQSSNSIETNQSAGSINSQSKVECPICLENLIGTNRDPQSTYCGHIFCKVCLDHSLRVKKICPVCRKAVRFRRVTRDYYHAVYLT